MLTGITTRYELDGPGIDFRYGVIFRTRPDTLGFTQPAVQWVLVFTRG